MRHINSEGRVSFCRWSPAVYMLVCAEMVGHIHMSNITPSERLFCLPVSAQQTHHPCMGVVGIEPHSSTNSCPQLTYHNPGCSSAILGAALPGSCKNVPNSADMGRQQIIVANSNSITLSSRHGIFLTQFPRRNIRSLPYSSLLREAACLACVPALGR